MADLTRLEFTPDPARIQGQAQLIMAREAASITRRIVAQAKSNAPVKTGNLARMIEEEPITFAGPFRIETGVTAKADYSAAVHEGTRPHVIRPKHARALAFPGAGGRTIFAASVNHPGTRPRPFLRNAAEDVAASLHRR